MTMTVIWTGMVLVSILCSLATGRGPEVAAAAVEGTSAAVQLALSIAGMLCLWTGVMEVMRQSGLADGLSRLLSPVLRRLFPQAAKDRDTMDAISANVSANLLGLGSAATPLGLEAEASRWSDRVRRSHMQKGSAAGTGRPLTGRIQRAVSELPPHSAAKVNCAK